MKNEIVLKGRRCKCGGCGIVFANLGSFDTHRVGSFEKNERRCEDREALLSSGYVVDEIGMLVLEK